MSRSFRKQTLTMVNLLEKANRTLKLSLSTLMKRELYNSCLTARKRLLP